MKFESKEEFIKAVSGGRKFKNRDGDIVRVGVGDEPLLAFEHIEGDVERAWPVFDAYNFDCWTEI